MILLVKNSKILKFNLHKYIIQNKDITIMSNDEINQEYEEFQQDLQIRSLHLKNIVRFQADEDKLMELLGEIKNISINIDEKPEN